MKLQVQHKKEKQISLQSITHPQKVKILILTQQKISFQDFYFIKPFQNLIKLDLSYNKIASFPNGFTFKHNKSLRILFLHYNKLQKLKSISVLAQSESIIYLTLFGNPLEETITRHFCVNTINTLMLMDDKIVGQQQRFQGILNLPDRKRNVGFPLVECVQQETSLQFLGSVIKQINLVRKFYLRFNPIIKIQRWIKTIIKTKQTYNRYLNAQIVNSQPNSQSSKQDLNKLNAQISENIGYKFQAIKQSGFKLHQNNQRIVYSLLKGWQAFKKFLASRLQQQKIFANFQWCQKNSVGYFMQPYLGRQIVVYRLPGARISYSKQKQLSKNRLQMIIYNNSNYLLQLKKKKINATKPIKTIYDKNCIVEIKATTQNKIQLISKSLLKRYKSTQYFPFLFEFSLLRTASAVKIQKNWRGYSSRNKFNCLKYIRTNKAATKIQKWVRNLKFKHRRQFLVNFYQHIKFSDLNFITISLESFCNLAQKKKQNYKRINFCLPFFDCKFQVRPKNAILQREEAINLLNFTEKKGNKSDYQIGIDTSINPFPSYFSKQITPLVLDQKVQEGIQESSLTNILLKGASKIQKFKANNVHYVRFYYNSTAQSNTRKAFLALKTYDFKQKSWLKQAGIDSKRFQIRNVYQSLHQGAFLKMVYDNKNQNVFVNLKFVVKQIQKKSNIKWSPTKARYFQGKIDYSCVILTGSYKAPQISNNQHEIQSNYNSVSPTKRQQARSQNEFLTNNKSQQSLHRSYISRTIISLSNQINNQSPHHRNKSLQKNMQSLNSQQSKISLLQEVMASGRTQPLKKQGVHNNEFDLMKKKKEFIQNQNKQHRYKLEMIEQMRNKNIQQISSSHKNSQILNKKIFVQNSNSLLLQKIKKVHQIKELQKDKVNSRYKQQFQLSFLKNGNTSIRHKMKLFEKERVQSSKQELQQLKYKSEWDKSQISRSAKKNKHYLSQRRQVLKTQIKQFSIQFSQGDLSVSHNPIQSYQISQQVQKSVGKIERQAKKHKDKKQQKALEYKVQEQNDKIINRRQREIERQKRQELKKKRVVHSVFPQQFYPLKEAKQLGFHLPKLDRRY